jgi:hypothetical protein
MDPALLPALFDALAVARTGSVAAAAARLHKTPSAVSQQLSRLTAALGVSLFERQGRGLGRRLLDEELARLAIQPRSTVDVPSVSLLLAYATGGLGIGLLPALACEGLGRGVTIEAAHVAALQVEAAKHDIASGGKNGRRLRSPLSRGASRAGYQGRMPSLEPTLDRAVRCLRGRIAPDRGWLVSQVESAAGGPTGAHAVATGADARGFYASMAWVCAVIAIAGFTPTYWAPVARGTFSGPPLLHLHGLLFSAWTLLFIVQARSAAAGRYERHRALGYVGIALASAMLFAGITVAIAGIRSGIERGYGDAARAFSIVPLTIILTFAAAVAVALASVRRTEVHMRMMLVASIAILPPAFARVLVLLFAPSGAGVGFGFPPPPIAFSLAPSLLADMLLVIPMVRDWRRRGRPHTAYVLSGAFLVVSQVARVFIAGTASWHGVTSWLLTLGG